MSHSTDRVIAANRFGLGARPTELAQIGNDASLPDWAREAQCDRFIALGDDIGLLVVSDRAVTCIARGSMSD